MKNTNTTELAYLAYDSIIEHDIKTAKRLIIKAITNAPDNFEAKGVYDYIHNTRAINVYERDKWYDYFKSVYNDVDLDKKTLLNKLVKRKLEEMAKTGVVLGYTSHPLASDKNQLEELLNTIQNGQNVSILQEHVKVLETILIDIQKCEDAYQTRVHVNETMQTWKYVGIGLGIICVIVLIIVLATIV